MKTRRPRRSADETRRELIEAGVAALRESGMSIGLDSVNLEQAVRDADVPRSSAYAAWSADREESPQEGFQRAVLREVIEERRRTLEGLGERSLATMAELSNTLPRRELLREVIRQTARDNAAEASRSVEWRLTIALRAILISSPESVRDQDLVGWLQQSANELSTFTANAVYRPLATAFEIQPRPQYGDSAYRLAEAAVAAFSEGISTRTLLAQDDQVETLAHPEGAEGPWDLYSIMIERVVDTFFVPISGTWADY